MADVCVDSAEETKFENFSIKHIQKLDQGKQGITGMISVNGIPHVYKISQYMNFLVDHEYLILKGLNEIKGFCPHFCELIGKKTLPIHPGFREKDQDPFEYHSKPIMLDVLIMEYIPESIPLYDIINNPTTPISVIMACIKQVMMAIGIAQRKKRFVHYDLHSLNILMKECRYDDVFLYVLDEENVFCVPTFGFIPTIIDYGFSTSKDIEGQPAYISLAYTEAGYMAPAFDILADAKIFLVSLAEDFKECRRGRSSTTKFRNIVKNIFKNLPIDWVSGWDKSENQISIVDQIFVYIENTEETHSHLFSEFPQMCMDILQSLVILPYRPTIEGSLRELRKAYRVLVIEFSKIENEVRDAFYSLYIFRQMIDLVRSLKNQYSDPNTRTETIKYFDSELFNIVNRVAKFCSLKTLNAENLLCALYAFGEQLEFQLYRLLYSAMKKKAQKYSKMEVQRLEHMYTIFDVNFKDTYKFNDRTVVHVLDGINETRSTFALTNLNLEAINELNDMKQIYRGHHLHSLITT